VTTKTPTATEVEALRVAYNTAYDAYIDDRDDCCAACTALAAHEAYIFKAESTKGTP
jgi:hypothetical protein